MAHTQEPNPKTVTLVSCLHLKEEAVNLDWLLNLSPPIIMVTVHHLPFLLVNPLSFSHVTHSQASYCVGWGQREWWISYDSWVFSNKSLIDGNIISFWRNTNRYLRRYVELRNGAVHNFVQCFFGKKWKEKNYFFFLFLKFNFFFWNSVVQFGLDH